MHPLLVQLFQGALGMWGELEAAGAHTLAALLLAKLRSSLKKYARQGNLNEAQCSSAKPDYKRWVWHVFMKRKWNADGQHVVENAIHVF